MDDPRQEGVSQIPVALPTGLQAGEQASDQPPLEVWTVDRIIAELEREFDGTLPEAAIRAAQARRDEIIPHLIELVKRATAAVRDGDFPDGSGQLIATFLLTEFRATEALPTIMDALSLPYFDIDELFGDALTEDFWRVLAALADPEQIDSLIANRSLDELVRWEAVKAYLLWVRDGRLTREQAVEKLRQHLRSALQNEDNEVAGSLVSELERYVSREAMEEIREVFRLGLVDESVVDLDSIEATLAEGDVRWQNALRRCPPTGIEDTLEELQGWQCYHGDIDDEFDEEFDDDADYGYEDELDREYQEDFARALGEKMGLRPASIEDPSMLDDDEFREMWNAAKRTEFPDTHSDTIRHEEPRVGRNEPCPCGSGKKFKKCCGKH